MIKRIQKRVSVKSGPAILATNKRRAVKPKEGPKVSRNQDSRAPRKSPFHSSINLPIDPPFPPMEALLVEQIPEGTGWQYEPKWDGFRCLIFRDGDKVELQSKAGQPLTRYFPEMVAAALRLKASKFVLDGELVIPEEIGARGGARPPNANEGRLSFNELLMRIHPAETRIRKLSTEHPAIFIAFDLLVDVRGKSLVEDTLEDRRKELQKFAAEYFQSEASIRLSPATTNLKIARKWFDEEKAVPALREQGGEFSSGTMRTSRFMGPESGKSVAGCLD